MLVITRKIPKANDSSRDDQSSLILELNGLEAEIIILKTQRNQVMIGIEAPMDVKVIRKELLS